MACACNSISNNVKVDTKDCTTDVQVNNNKATVDVNFKGQAELVFDSSAGSLSIQSTTDQM